MSVWQVIRTFKYLGLSGKSEICSSVLSAKQLHYDDNDDDKPTRLSGLLMINCIKCNTLHYLTE